MASFNFLIAEDHSIVRMGISLLIREMFPDAGISEATTFNSTLQCLSSNSFNLLILDINIPGGDNLQMIEAIRLRQAGICILIFSSYDENIYALRYLKAGANGYLQKECGPEEIKSAILKVLNGETYASQPVQQQLFKSLSLPRHGSVQGLQSLSNREMEIMKMLAKGMSPTEIKSLLKLQLSTISTYKSRIFEKLDVSNVVELAEKIKTLL